MNRKFLEYRISGGVYIGLFEIINTLIFVRLLYLIKESSILSSIIRYISISHDIFKSSLISARTNSNAIIFS